MGPERTVATASTEGPPGGNRAARTTLRDLQKQSTHRLLLESAARLFTERGYAATSVEDIGRAAGVTRATFYLHFRTKADLVAEFASRRKADNDRLAVDLAKAARAGDRATLRRWLDDAFSFWERHHDTVHAEEQAASIDPDVQRSRTHAFDQGVAAIEDGLREAGRFDEGGRSVRAVAAYAQLQGLFRRWMQTGWDVGRDEMLDVLTDMWLAAFTEHSDT